MRWMKMLGLSQKSAGQAKDRLQIIIAQQRTESTSPDYLPMLRNEIMELIAKYVNVKSEKIHVDLQCKDNNSVLELNVILPAEANKAAPTEAG